jgi:hypothetical protein
MGGVQRTTATSFRRYEGALYFGQVERTLSPPREVERIWLLDSSCLQVARLLALSRAQLAAMTREAFPSVESCFVREERFCITQFVMGNLEALIEASDLRITRWLESGCGYLTVVTERAGDAG